MNEQRAAFEAWWADERKRNGGTAIGADYRHWALKGYESALSQQNHSRDKLNMVNLLTPELEADLRAKINPVYVNVRGTESYERKAMMDEIDRLRNIVDTNNTAKQVSQPVITDAQIEAARDAVAEALGDCYDCSRSWSAWRVRTMSESDFYLVAESPERVSEITDAALSAIIAAAMKGST